MATFYERAYRMTDHHSTITTLVSYASSAALVVSSAFQFFEEHSQSLGILFGILFGGITCLTNYRAKKALVVYYQDTSTKKRREDLDSDL